MNNESMTYKIKQSSPWLFAITMLVVIFSGAAILIVLSNNQILPKDQPLIFMLCFAPVMGLAFYLPRFTATADIEILMHDDGIKIKRLRQFILHNKPDVEYKWTDIKYYVFQPDRQFDQFKLILKDGTKFKYYHNNNHNSKDDFRKFIFDFIQKVEQLNRDDNDKRNNIKLGKTIYETTSGLIIAVFSVIIIIIGFPIMLVALPHEGPPDYGNYAMLAASYLGAIYFVIDVFAHGKKRNEFDDSFK